MTTIEIRTVRIDGRKLSLTAYRQVVSEHPIAGDGSFAGRPLGVVNRHELCDGRYEHRHVLWLRDGELRTGVVYEPERAYFVCPAATAYAEVLAAHEPKRFEYLGRAFWSFDLAGVRFRTTLSDEAANYPSSKRAERVAAWYERQMREPFDELAMAVPTAAYRQRWADVLALPQLFIGA